VAKYEYEEIRILIEDQELSKVNISTKLGISRPTLDNWLAKYRRDTALISEYGGQDTEYIFQLEKENKELKEQIKVFKTKKIEDLEENEIDQNVTNTIDMAWEKIFK